MKRACQAYFVPGYWRITQIIIYTYYARGKINERSTAKNPVNFDKSLTYKSISFWRIFRRSSAQHNRRSSASRRIIMKFLTSPSALERFDAPHAAVFHVDPPASSTLTLKITPGPSGFIVGFPPRASTRVTTRVSMYHEPHRRILHTAVWSSRSSRRYPSWKTTVGAAAADGGGWRRATTEKEIEMTKMRSRGWTFEYIDMEEELPMFLIGRKCVQSMCEKERYKSDTRRLCACVKIVAYSFDTFCT